MSHHLSKAERTWGSVRRATRFVCEASCPAARSKTRLPNSLISNEVPRLSSYCRNMKSDCASSTIESFQTLTSGDVDLDVYAEPAIFQTQLATGFAIVNGQFYLGCRGHKCVHVYDTDGETHLRKIVGAFTYPFHLLGIRDRLYMVEEGSKQLSVLNADGETLQVWALPSSWSRGLLRLPPALTEYDGKLVLHKLSMTTVKGGVSLEHLGSTGPSAEQ